MGKRINRKSLYLKIYKNIKYELWISPIGTNQEFFLTTGKTTMKKIKNWQIPNLKLL